MKIPIMLGIRGHQFMYTTEKVKGLTQHCIYQDGQLIVAEITDQLFYEWAADNIESEVRHATSTQLSVTEHDTTR